MSERRATAGSPAHPESAHSEKLRFLPSFCSASPGHLLKLPLGPGPRRGMDTAQVLEAYCLSSPAHSGPGREDRSSTEPLPLCSEGYHVPARPQYSSRPTQQPKRLPASFHTVQGQHTPWRPGVTALTSVGSPHPKCGPLCFPDHCRGKHPPAHALTGKHSPGDLSVLTGRLYLLTQQAQVLAEPGHHSLGVGVAEGTSTAFRCRPRTPPGS